MPAVCLWSLRCWLAFVLALAVASHVAAQAPHHYKFKRVHQQAIEGRLEDWRQRALADLPKVQHSMDRHIVAWRVLMRRAAHRDERTELDLVNRFINEHVDYHSDYELHHRGDFWSVLSDTLLNGGDCEDYALAKAASLFLLGWPANRMHLIVGMTRVEGRWVPHAVLVVQTRDGKFWLLNNLSDRVERPEDSAFHPVYGVDRQGVWLFRKVL